MLDLELLAPARNAEIGIAAIDCGADAVYIAGPAFGARQDAGNPVDEIARLCVYAHRFGARVFVTVNTIVYDDELPRIAELLKELVDAGADAFIIQDLGVAALCRQLGLDVPLHASTQCAIRNVEKARFYESLGFSRLVLERELPLSVVREIRAVVSCELEFFVHGALCVCYSGQCYLSEHLTGRSANRGACVQACRRVYDLETLDGNVLVRDKALLSLKDYNLSEHLPELAEAGVCSFKIEGRLKNASYVSNVTRAYSLKLDALVAAHPELYRRASFGRVTGGFIPSLTKTFNRGYTELFFSSDVRGWSSMDIPKSSGEPVGRVRGLRPSGRNIEITLDLLPGIDLSNGDGFCFSAVGGAVEGFRGDICRGNVIISKPVPGLKAGMPLMRNISAGFEREISSSRPERLIDVALTVRVEGLTLEVEACSEDGRKACLSVTGTEPARDTERMLSIICGQLSKRSGVYNCHFDRAQRAEKSPLPLLSSSTLNALRRDLAALLDAQPCICRPLMKGRIGKPSWRGPVTTYENVANALAEKVYADACTAAAYDNPVAGPVASPAASIAKAFELTHASGTALMRTAYCIRRELGLCCKEDTRSVSGVTTKAVPSLPSVTPKTTPSLPAVTGNLPAGDLILRDTITGRPLRLHFDCSRCEMAVL